MLLKINDRIRNRQLDYFNKFSLSLKYDAMASAFGFEYYFDPGNTEQKELSCIGHYHECSVEHNGELLITGQILSINMTSAPERKLVQIGGYALPGVFEDCTIPHDIALQTDTLSLREIAQRLCSKFGIKMRVDISVAADMNRVYEKSTAKDGQNIKSYLTQLTTQRDIVITHTEKGELLFTKAETKKPPLIEFDFSAGTMPGTTMQLQFNGQAMHSHIVVRQQADENGGNAAESEPLRNPYVFPKTVYRPIVITQSSGTDIDSDKAARQALAAELKTMKLTITTDRWEVDGKILKPNNTVTVINPEVYLYNKSTWFIEQIDFKGDEKETTAVLTCVLPCVYDGTTPKYLFDGINLH